MQKAVPSFCAVVCCMPLVCSVVVAFFLNEVPSARAATARNLATSGDAIFGVAANFFGTDDHTVANQGPIEEINDGVIHENLTPDAFIINGDGQSGQSGNGADTYATGFNGHYFDFVGVLFASPQFGVTSVRVQHYLANDGGWWGPTNVIAGGTPLTSGDLSSPVVQVTANGGVTWSTVGGVTSDYIAQYTGAVRGSGFPNATSGPLATFNFPQQNGIDGIRLIGNAAGPADGNGFVGVTEFEAFGIAQELAIEVNSATGMVRLANDVQSTIELDFYRITSASKSLNPSGWNSLENPKGNPAGFPSGNGSGNGWEEFSNLDSGIVAEGYLHGSSALAPGESVNLGFLFAGGDQDLVLRYRAPGGQFVDVLAVSVAGLAGDFDWDGDVDGQDFLTWQRGASPAPLSSSDLAAWQASYGSTVPVTLASVPEPCAFVLMFISAATTANGRTGLSGLCHPHAGQRRI